MDNQQPVQNSVGSSYVDQYAPPTNGAHQSHTLPPQLDDMPVATHTPSMPTPALAPTASSSAAVPPATPISEALEDQNIFDLLGLTDVPDNEKEKFLDELQQVIWEDFLENDVELLLTQDELIEFKKIQDQATKNDEQKQIEMIDYLQKLVPDLEDIMLDKALELKSEMMKDRVSELKVVYAENPDMLKLVEAADKMVADQKWKSAADQLNAIKA